MFLLLKSGRLLCNSRYVSRLARLTPLSCSPKHNVLFGWPATAEAREIRGVASGGSIVGFAVAADRATEGAIIVGGSQGTEEWCDFNRRIMIYH